MELKPNMYVRTKKGKIYKFETNNSMAKNGAKKYMVNCSYNLIDLIEPGDYVNGGRVVEHTYQPGRLFVECIYVGGKEQTTIENYSWELTSKYVEDEPDAIKSIVTKEMFESMSYKVQD